MATAIALVLHLGLLATTRLARLEPSEEGGMIEIPVEIVTAMPAAALLGPVATPAPAPVPDSEAHAPTPPEPGAPAPSVDQPAPGAPKPSAAPPPNAASEPVPLPQPSAAPAPPLPIARPVAAVPKPPVTPPKAIAESEAAVERRKADAARQWERARLAIEAKLAARNAQRQAAAQLGSQRPSPPAPASPAVQTIASVDDFAAYGRRMIGRITGLTHYPEEDRARGVEGTVVVAFSVGAAGQVTSAVVSRSSGDHGLDSEALATVRRAGPFGPPPPASSRSFSVPLRYRL